MRFLIAACLALTSLPALAAASDEPPAKQIFGHAESPARMAPESIGSYAKGCLAGAQALPMDGPNWSVMRLSRQRYWGHPNLVRFIERFSAQAPQVGLAGLLIGDMSQVRGGPMLTGHASHQIGLDVDVWLRPLPTVRYDPDARETISSHDVVEGRTDLDEELWPHSSRAMIRLAAQDPEVERIFVNPAIKKKLCEETHPNERAWLQKLRPWWGHDAHFHVRLACPPDSPGCRPQEPVEPGDGCDALGSWYTEAPYAAPDPDAPKKRELTLADLPAACRGVATAP